jgi:(S)-ureidoglycine aminohydrolase
VHNLGVTRATRRQDHLLQTPDTFIRAPLPGMQAATAIIHAAPANGAAFIAYTAEMQKGGSLGPSSGERFVYVLEGAIAMAAQKLLKAGYTYVPAGVLSDTPQSVVAAEASRVLVIEKEYQPVSGSAAPKPFTGNEATMAPQPLLGDPDIEVRTLLPDSPEFDFAVNSMTFQPGASLGMTEMHVMEHGLLMLEGGGIYRLNDSWYPVAAGDFIWMAAFCPQWFGAIGKSPAKYLIYKDWNRHPL